MHPPQQALNICSDLKFLLMLPKNVSLSLSLFSYHYKQYKWIVVLDDAFSYKGWRDTF